MRLKRLNHILRTVAFVCAIIVAQTAAADSKVKKVSGEYTYYADKTDSPASSKRKALEGARLNAISKEFGTIVSQDILQADRLGSDGESTKFFSLSASEVKGEWIADDGEPTYDVNLDKDDNLVVTCRVNGTAKAITNEAVDFEALALRNGTTKGNASTDYQDGDNLYLYVSTPCDGYLGVYLLDETENVITMFPYSQDPKQEGKLKKDFDYVFFDPTKANGSFGEIDAFGIAAPEEIEFNKLYVIFSPTSFSGPMTRMSEDGLRRTKEEDFTKWLVKSRRNDPKMGVKQINLKLHPSN